MENPTPPNRALKFLRWFCREDYLEEIEGDLFEIFEMQSEESPKKASRRFTWNVIRYFRPEFIKLFHKNSYLTKNLMLTHFLKIAFRNLARSKTYSIINISGLVVGMAAALILTKYVAFFFYYDQYHQNSDRIYCIQQEERKEGVVINSGNHTYQGLGEFVLATYPEVASISRYDFNVETLVSTKNSGGELIKFNEKGIYTVDSSFLSIFSFDFIHGDKASALSEPGAVVITESIAQRYFEDDDVLGKTLVATLPWGEKTTLHVTGVIRDIPVNSKFNFDFLKSTVGTEQEDAWKYPDHITYLLLNESADRQLLAEKISRDISSFEAFNAYGRELSVNLIPITGNLENIEYLLGLVGILIILVSWINFINLTSAKALNRFKEMGVRKVLGSAKAQIIRQFVLEGLLLNAISLICAGLITWLLYPALMAFTHGQILPLFEWQTPINMLFLVLFFLGSILSSLYPAIVLSVINPIEVLKGKLLQQTQKVGFRKTLVIFQFSISIILIIGVFIISDQMHFMQNQELGVDISQTLIIKGTKDDWNGKEVRLETLKAKLSGLSTVERVSSSTMIPGEGIGHQVKYLTQEHNEILLNLIGIDEKYVDDYKLTILAGIPFRKDFYWENRHGVIINKTAAHALGFQDVREVVNQKLVNLKNNKTYEILAVVDDYHQQSLKEAIPPLVFDFNPFRGHISLKLNAVNYQGYQNLTATIESIEQIWNNIYPDQAFDYYFLDENFNAQYQEDIRFKKIFSVFTASSIFIACLGLFGLSLFVSQKRKKEIGIRKTLGASSIHVVGLFTKDYLFQILIATFIGAPIAYLLMHQWLESYSFRTTIGVGSLVYPILLLISVSLLSVAFQVIKAAYANPAHSLKDE